jgi:hypothetical protein
MVIEALKTARNFIENDRQALAEGLTVNGEIVFEDDIDRKAMAEYVNVLAVIDGALKAAQAQESPFEIGQRLRQEGRGISDLWGAVDNDADMKEAQRGFDEVMRPALVQDVPETNFGDMPADVKEPGRNHYEDGDVFERIAAMKKSAAQQDHEPENEPFVSPASVQEPVAYWIPKAEQFCIADPSGRPFAKAWEPLYTAPPAAPAAAMQETDHGDELTIAYMSGVQRGKELAAQPVEPLTDDTRRLDALAKNYWDLRCFDMSDEDIGWRVIEHHMTKPHERTVAEVFRDDPRQAIDAAIEAAHGITKGGAA